MKKKDGWKKVGPLEDILYAEMLGNVLKEKEIPHYFVRDGFVNAYGIKGSSTLNGVSYVFIPETFYPTVKEIMEVMFRDDSSE